MNKNNQYQVRVGERWIPYQRETHGCGRLSLQQKEAQKDRPVKPLDLEGREIGSYQSEPEVALKDSQKNSVSCEA